MGIKLATLDIVLESIVRINQCFQLGSQMFPAKQWSNCIVRSVWMCTRQNHHDTTTQTEPTLEQAFHTCCLWYIQSIVPKDLPTNLFQGFMDLKYTIWHTKSSNRRRQISKRL